MCLNLAFRQIELPASDEFGLPNTTQPDQDWSQFPGFTYTFDAEGNFDYIYHRQWFRRYWIISLGFTAAYLLAIYVGQRFMQNRKAYDLRKPLAIWSAMLALFSFGGSLRGIPEMSHVLSNHGFRYSYCNASFAEDVRLQFWTWIFVWSKVFELGDTIFIVLRKQRLIFLHYYHHAITMVYTFYSFSEMSAFFRWFGTMNYLVHTLMYAYYSLKALRISVPKGIAMIITVSQIVQLFLGGLVSYLAFKAKIEGEPCEVNSKVATFGIFVYLSFIVLFVNFFAKTYLKPRSGSATAIKKEL